MKYTAVPIATSWYKNRTWDTPELFHNQLWMAEFGFHWCYASMKSEFPINS